MAASPSAASSTSRRSQRHAHNEDEEETHQRKGSQDVRLSNRNLGAVPPFVMEKNDMRLLDLSSNKLTILPNILVWRSEATLRSLLVQNNLLVALPSELCRCQMLQDLRVSSNQLSQLPEALGSVDSLTRLDVQGNRLVDLPPSLSALVNLRVLNLSRNLLRNLDENMMSPLTAMTDLNLDANRLSALPLSLAFLRDLRFLRASANSIEVLEVDVATLPSLEELHFADNRLAKLPAHCWNRGQATRLVALDLSGNQLTDIPRQLALLKKLRVFGLARNPNLPLPILEASYTGADAALGYLQKRLDEEASMHQRMQVAEEQDEEGTSIARLDEMRRLEKAERAKRMQAVVSNNNSGVGAFYQSVAGLMTQGIPLEELNEFRDKLANRMLNEFQHEGYSHKAHKKQQAELSKAKARADAAAASPAAGSPGRQSPARRR